MSLPPSSEEATPETLEYPPTTNICIPPELTKSKSHTIEKRINLILTLPPRKNNLTVNYEATQATPSPSGGKSSPGMFHTAG